MDENELYLAIQRLNGVENPTPLPDKRRWRLHLKATTLLDGPAVLGLPMRTETKEKLSKALRFLKKEAFDGMQTSRTIKATQLSTEEIEEAVRMGKFEECDAQKFSKIRLPYGAHGVNVFTVPELKGRRRLITEPLINAVINRKTIPSIEYPSRLARRQSLRYAKYMLQIDFEAFYDAIPMPSDIRDNFVFRKGHKYYRLRTLPTGARWSVAVGQSITSAIVDIDTPIVVHTMIDNIMVAARVGEENEFLQAVRKIVSRIKKANLLTSPSRETLEKATDAELLRLSEEPNTFLGEVFEWNGKERLIRNSVKTVAKLGLALAAEKFSCRSFVSLISLILYALHTTRLNPASAFRLLRAYRGIYRQVTSGLSWDADLPYLDPTVHAKLMELGKALYNNDFWQIADVVEPTYEESYYQYKIVTDASYSGWGAYVHDRRNGTVTAYQQHWEDGTQFKLPEYHYNKARAEGFFDAHHSAHAEPRAASLIIRQLIQLGIPDGSRIALVTDHIAIVHAQRRVNGFGGIGRGYALNRLFELVHDLWFHKNIQVTFFHLSGNVNPADSLSRYFGDIAEHGGLISFPANDTQLPLLSATFSPVCEKLSFKGEKK